MLCWLQIALLYLDPFVLAGLLLRLKTGGRDKTTDRNFLPGLDSAWGGRKFYIWNCGLGFSSSLTQGLSLLSGIVTSQPTLCSGYKGAGVCFFWSGSFLLQAGHPTNTCPRDAQSVQNIILSDLSLILSFTGFFFCLFMCWVIGWIRAKTKANILYL